MNRESTSYNIYIGKRVLVTPSKVDIQTTTTSYDNKQNQKVDLKKDSYTDHYNKKNHLNYLAITN